MAVLRRFLPLRHEHCQAFTSTAGFEELAHGKRVAGVAAIAQRRNQLGGAFGQDDVAIEDNGVAGKMRGFLGLDVDQIAQVIADRMLPVFIERRREPDGAAIRQRAKAGVDMIKARIDQLD